jgi:membrane associated rhomboid family serine protease
MRSRYPSASGFSYSFGPGPLTPAIKVLIGVNVVAFIVTALFMPSLTLRLGLRPADVFHEFHLWQPITYMFLHAGIAHILFNMLALWMFGVDLEHRWGTRAFARYYAITGVGAGIATVLISKLPFDVTSSIYGVTTIGASGAIYGLLLAWAMLFPHRQILFMFIFPLPARVAAALMGAMSFFSAITGTNGSVAEATHLAGLAVGWFYLQGPRKMRLELQYRLTKWRMDRARKRFNIHQGGRGGDGGWGGRVH